MKMIKKFNCLIFVALLLSWQAFATSVSSTVIADDPMLIRGKLDNGMDYIIYPHNNPKGQVNFWLQIHSGSLHEDDDQRGIAHFVEHMMFNGSRDYPHNSVIEEFEKIGLKFGRDVNAYTNYAETVYQFNMPSDNKEHIDKVMNIFYNWASQATFDPDEVNDERGIIIEEWRANQGLKWRNGFKRRPFTLTDSRHFIREPIGLMDTIKTVTPERIKDYYERWYQPQNMTFIVVGDIDLDYAKSIITDTFSSLSNRDINQYHYKTLNYKIPAVNKTRYNVISDDENTINSFSIIYRYPKIFAHDEQTFIEQTHYSLLTQLFNQRFHDLIQEGKLPDAQSGMSLTSQLGDDYQATYFRITAKKEDLTGAINNLFIELERIDRFGFTQAELERLTQTQLAYLENAAQNPASRDARMLTARIANVSLYDLPFISPLTRYELAQKAYQAIDLAAINKEWQKLRHNPDRIFEQLISTNIQNNALSEEQLIQLSNDVKNMSLEPYVQSVQQKPLMNEKPKAGNIIKTQALDNIATQFTLSNGANVIVYPTDFDDTSINIMAIGKHGALSFSDSDYHAVKLANKVIGVSGLGDLSASELKYWMAQHFANMNTMLQDHQVILSLTGHNEKIEPLFQLIYQRFNATKVNDEIWKIVKQAQENDIKSLSIQPRAQFNQSVYEMRYDDDSRALPITQAQLDAITLPQFIELDRQLFSDLSQFTFIIVGNVKADDIADLSKTYIASLANLTDDDSMLTKNRVMSRQNSTQNIIIEGESEPYAQVVSYLFTSLSEHYGEDIKQQLAAFNFALSRDLRVEIREKQSGVYSISSMASINPYVDEFVYRLAFSCDPIRYQELLARSKQVIEQRIEKGITDEELAEYKKMQLRAVQLQKSSNSHIARLLLSGYSMYNDMSLFNNIDSNIENLTTAEINKTVKQFFTPALIESTAVLIPNNVAETPKVE